MSLSTFCFLYKLAVTTAVVLICNLTYYTQASIAKIPTPIVKLDNSDKKKWIGWNNMDQGRYLSILAGANIMSAVVSHPFTVVMMRKQAGKLVSSGGPFGLVKDLRQCIDTLGYRGLFRGLIPIVLETPSHALYFMITESSRDYLRPLFFRIGLPKGVLEPIQTIISRFNNPKPLRCFFTVPAEILGAKLAIQDGDVSFPAMVKSIYKADGLFGFFKGFTSSLATHVFHSFQWWLAYGVSRSYFEKLELNPIAFDALSGTFAGVMSAFLTHPLDTMKLRIQMGTAKEPNFIKSFAAATTSGGFKGLFDGLSASLLSSALSSAGFSVIYELVKRASLIETEVPNDN